TARGCRSGSGPGRSAAPAPAPPRAFPAGVPRACGGRAPPREAPSVTHPWMTSSDLRGPASEAGARHLTGLDERLEDGGQPADETGRMRSLCLQHVVRPPEHPARDEEIDLALIRFRPGEP